MLSKWHIFVVLGFTFCLASIDCQWEDAGPYVKVLTITGTQRCHTWSHCRHTYADPIKNSGWTQNDGGHCSVITDIGRFIDVACGCNNHWSPDDNIESTLRIELQDPNPPPPPPPPTTTGDTTPPSTSTPTDNNDDDSSLEKVALFFKIVLPICFVATLVCLLCVWYRNIQRRDTGSYQPIHSIQEHHHHHLVPDCCTDCCNHCCNHQFNLCNWCNDV